MHILSWFISPEVEGEKSFMTEDEETAEEKKDVLDGLLVMSTFLGRIFRSKHKNGGNNKENMEPTEVERDMFHRRSVRSVGKGGTRQRATRFDCPDDDFIPATAPYHTVTAPKMRKGPQSCPGGYKDEYDTSVMDRSFESEFYTREKRDRRHREHEYNQKSNRSMRETSEYGSQDPSPTGQYHRGQKTTNYRTELDDSDNEEEYQHKEKIMQLESACRRFMNKLKHSEERHFFYKHELKQCQRAKDNAEKVLMQQINNLQRENDRHLSKIRKLESLISASRPFYSTTSGSEMVSTTASSTETSPLLINARRIEGQLSSHQSHRHYSNLPGPGLFPLSAQTNHMSLLPNISHLQGNSTPSTSAFGGGSVTGAGESLTEDVSFMNPGLNFDSSFMSSQNRTAHGDSNTTNYPLGDLSRTMMENLDGGDETKNFRKIDDTHSVISMETPRLSNNISGLSVGMNKNEDESVPLGDNGYSNQSTLTRAAPKRNPIRSIRRTTSESDVASPLRKTRSTDL